MTPEIMDRIFQHIQQLMGQGSGDLTLVAARRKSDGEEVAMLSVSLGVKDEEGRTGLMPFAQIVLNVDEEYDPIDLPGVSVVRGDEKEAPKPPSSNSWDDLLQDFLKGRGS